jgi:hypothetical protein
MATTKIITEVTDLNAASSTNGLKMPTGGAYSGTPTDGMVRNNTTGSSQGSASTMQHYNGTEWKNFENVNVVPLPDFTADFLVLAGGASGGSNGGGGGAGGLLTTTTYGGSETPLGLFYSTAYDVTVGAGGVGLLYPSEYQLQGKSGGDSTFSTITSTGGGGGGSNNLSGVNGGSGGGAGTGVSGSTGAGSGIAGQGNDGGPGGGGGHPYRGGGGGGAGAAGSSASTGNGGNGLAVSIIGSSVTYAGGGGGTGGTQGGAGGAGGTGGGGAGGQGSSGVPGQTATIVNSGSGGGSSGDAGRTGGGAAGIVILRYPTADVSSYAVTGTLDTTTDTAYPVANTAYYKLNGDVLDSSGNGYNGTASNLSPYAAGRFGQAAVFNGSNSKIEINGLSTFLGSSSSKSWSCWIKTTSTSGGNRAIISDYNTGVGNYNFDCFMTPADGKVYLVSNAGNTSVYILSSATINNGVWHHICAVQNTTTNTLELYIDSNLQGTISIGTGTRTSPLFIGTYGVGYYWDGSIDQVRIFNSAISAANVTSLYNEGTVVESTDGTDSILQFIGGTGTVTFS